MKTITEILNINDIKYYIYEEELNTFNCNCNTNISTVYYMKELLKITGILDNNDINYIIDINQNIILKNI